MSTVDDATATMISNFPARTGRPLDEWVRLEPARLANKSNRPRSSRMRE
jgi:hypothetical protein